MKKPIPLEDFLPAIDKFSLFVKRIFLIRGCVASSCVASCASALFGIGIGSDVLVSFSVALCTALLFCWYLITVYTKEASQKHAIATVFTIQQIAEPEEDLADLFSRLALSCKTLPTHIITCRFHWVALISNRIISACAWQPVHTLIEILFIASIDYHIKNIKAHPTSLETHAALANCYIMLAQHYQEPLTTFFSSKYLPWKLSSSLQNTLRAKSTASSASAIEELSILRAFAPQELWVREQLAISYHDLAMTEKEIEECEAIIHLCPDDDKTLLRLGVLYFQHNMPSKGLKIYETLKAVQPLLAEELISHYSGYTPVLLENI